MQLINMISIINIINSWVNVKPDLITKCFAELIGTCLFHIIGSLSPTPVGNSVALMSLVFFTAKLSGGHLNPCISLIFSSLGYTNPIELVLYIGSQIIGAILGALFLSTIVPNLSINNKTQIEYDGCFVPNKLLSYQGIILSEFIGTLAFAISVFSVVWYTQNKKGYGTIGPIMVGISLMAPAFAFANFTGSSFNPARTLGSYFVYKCTSSYYVKGYIIGEITGALASLFMIIPWYGISIEPWYEKIISKRRTILYQYNPSIKLQPDIVIVED